MVEFEKSEEMNSIVENLIHSELRNELDRSISGAKIICLLKHGKQDSLAKIQKPGGAWKYLLQNKCDFVMVSPLEAWEQLEDKQKEAVIFHELLHVKSKIDNDGNTKWKLVRHDIEEFLAVIRNYGAYREELVELENII